MDSPLCIAIVVFLIAFSRGISFDVEIGLSPVKNSSNSSSNSSTAQPDRYWGVTNCSSSDIVIMQGPTQPLPSGIPTYSVSIMNACNSCIDISRIHLNCGWFSSARLINPRIFKRLRYNDCLVNDGKPLPIGVTLSFQYANTFPYGLTVSSLSCP